MNYSFVNHQDYLADRFLIADAWFQEISKIALFKIKTWQLASCTSPGSASEKEEVRELIQDAFFSFVPPAFVLSEEGFYFSEVAN